MPHQAHHELDAREGTRLDRVFVIVVTLVIFVVNSSRRRAERCARAAGSRRARILAR